MPEGSQQDSIRVEPQKGFFQKKTRNRMLSFSLFLVALAQLYRLHFGQLEYVLDLRTMTWDTRTSLSQWVAQGLGRRTDVT